MSELTKFKLKNKEMKLDKNCDHPISKVYGDEYYNTNIISEADLKSLLHMNEYSVMLDT